MENDTYAFFLGDGVDTINDVGNLSDIDNIWIGTGGGALSTLSFTDSSPSAATGNLAIQYGATDTITVTGHYITANNADIERIYFDGGSFAGYEFGSDFYAISTDDTGPRDATAGANTVLVGDSAANTLNGNTGNDLLFGGDGGDTLNGNAGNDLLVGGNGGNTMNGGDNNDTLVGGHGNDALTGGAGADNFVFKPSFGNDTINDYVAGTDSLTFDSSIFTDAAALLAATRTTAAPAGP